MAVEYFYVIALVKKLSGVFDQSQLIRFAGLILNFFELLTSLIEVKLKFTDQLGQIIDISFEFLALL